MPRAWCYVDAFGPEHLHIVEVPEPSPGPGEAVVAVRACSLNFRDLAVSRGAYGGTVTTPLVPLSDGAGEVLATGPGVTRVKPGDRVAGIFMQKWLSGPVDDEKAASAMGGAIDGMLAERVCLNAEGLTRIPEHLSYEEAATLPCAGVTAWNALFHSGQLRPGQTVLTLGTGGVSTFALQFAKMAGARVIATSGNPVKLDRVKAMGADEVLNYKATPDWDKSVKELTHGVGVDHIVEVGGAGTLPRSIRAGRRGGHIALIGVLTGGGEIDPRPILMKAIRLQGIYVGSREMFEEMNRAISLSGLRPVVDHIFAFADFPAAMQYMATGAHFGKICIAT
jgi:NADPH:quinone reductase-like Zn-dependent oxidoreductase